MKTFLYSTYRKKKEIVPVYGETVFLDENFSYLPSGWVNNGFTVNNGLEISGLGGMDYNITYDKNSFLDAMTVKMDVIINDVESRFGIGKNLGFRGSFARVDFKQNKIRLGIILSTGNEATYKFETPITIPKITGEEYTVELTKNAQIMQVKFYNKSNPEIFDEIYQDYDTDTEYQGSAWGAPFAVFFEGDIKITNFKYIALTPKTSKIASYGDSITAGFTLIDKMGNLHSRWNTKLLNDIGYNGYISGKGGINAQGTDDYIDFELEYLKAKYYIVMLGTNDIGFDDWKNAMLSIISKIENNGGIPVICSLMPRYSRQLSINSFNDYIFNTLSLSYDIIDFASAVTVNGDRQTWVPEYLQEDDVHPTVEGHEAMYQWILDNNSYLLRN